MGEDGSQLWCMLIAVGALLEWKCDRDRPDCQKHSRRDQMICLKEGATEATVLMADSIAQSAGMQLCRANASWALLLLAWQVCGAEDVHANAEGMLSSTSQLMSPPATSSARACGLNANMPAACHAG